MTSPLGAPTKLNEGEYNTAVPLDIEKLFHINQLVVPLGPVVTVGVPSPEPTDSGVKDPSYEPEAPQPSTVVLETGTPALKVSSGNKFTVVKPLKATLAPLQILEVVGVTIGGNGIVFTV